VRRTFEGPCALDSHRRWPCNADIAALAAEFADANLLQVQPVVHRPGVERGWSGETMLYDHNQDAVACVTPRPGRLAIFDGTILHAGRPPNRICYAPRYTLAFKLAPPPP
jgi:hypothetical protein